jgi:hypothetical protein
MKTDYCPECNKETIQVHVPIDVDNLSVGVAWKCMNWKEIKEKYPKALQKAIETGEWFIDNDGNVRSCGNGLRVLYDFFDENNITIIIGRGLSRYITNLPDSPWWFNIEYGKYAYIQDPTEVFNERKEAESAAFEKAFEILENKL